MAINRGGEMRFLFIFGVLGFLFTACANRPIGVTGNQPSKPIQVRSLTLTEELIEQERLSYSVNTRIDTPDVHDRIKEKYDDIIDDAARAFENAAIDIEKARMDMAEATRAFETIESVLVENHFMLYIKTSRLHEMLTPQPAKSTWFLTSERRAFYEAHPDDLYYHFDCDLGSLIILGIAERMGLPISFVEVPDHNFVRWRFEDGTHINWDTNAAGIYTDDQFRQGQSPTSGNRFDRETEERLGYLKDMSRAEIKGYYFGLMGSRLSAEGEVEEAARIFDQAVTLRPNGTTAQNNYAWMIVTRPEFKGVTFGEKAVRLSKGVFDLSPNDRNANDTYSCALAAASRFDDAVYIERLAFDREDKIEAFQAGRTCLDMVLAGELDV